MINPCLSHEGDSLVIM